jgi:hypothetical protein
MKAFTVIILASLTLSVLIVVLPTRGYEEPSVGVKIGDWIEYDVNITGNPPAVHRNVTWMRIEVMQVDATSFPVNLTVRFANGTLDSSIWKFNFSEGNTEGWVIIPSGLGLGDTFFDNFSKTDKHIMIQSQEQKTVLGAARTVTYANDAYRDKQWDKATGVFISSSEIFRNWSAYVTAVETNMWSPQILGINQNAFYALAGTSIVLTASIVSLVFVAERKRSKIV